MYNNSKRHIFLTQFMIMTGSIHTHLTIVWYDRFEAMWRENVTVNLAFIFVLNRVDFIKKIISVLRQIEK